MYLLSNSKPLNWRKLWKGILNMIDLLSDYPSENIRIIKQDGSKIDNVDVLFESHEIICPDTSIVVEEGDYIERDLPTGKTERYLVVDVDFRKAEWEFPARYSIKIEKSTAYRSAKKATTINEYHITNAEKVNIQSTDNSITYNITANDVSLMDTLRNLAHGLENEQEVVKNISSMQESIGKKNFAEKYNAFIQSVANHMTIFAPFIPALTAFLAK